MPSVCSGSELAEELEELEELDEEELDELMWADDPRGNGFLAYTPAPPSEYAYHPSLYGPQIDADPSFRVKLGRAEQLASLAGAARAIRETVLMVLEGRNA